MVFDLYVIVRRFAINLLNNLIWSFFWWVLLFFVSYVYSHRCWTNQNRSTMRLTSPVLCVSDAFYFYRISCFWIFCIYCHQPNKIRYCFYNFYICCHQTNQIRSMMSLKMTGLPPGLLVCALFLLVLTIPLVVFVAWVLAFLNKNPFQLWCCSICLVCTNRIQVQRW